MTTVEEVQKYFDVGRYSIKIIDGVVDINAEDCSLADFIIKKIPFQLGKVTGNLRFIHTSLTTLEGSPETVTGYFSCSGCVNLTNLIGGPKIVGGDYYCYDIDNLESFEGMPDTTSKFVCDWKPNIHMLKLLKYPNLTIYQNQYVEQIMKKYTGQKPLRQAIIQCQKELIDAGYSGCAKL